MKLTAEQVYDRLVNEDKILTLEGQIKFYLGDVNIVVKQKDVVGNIMQEWLEGWLKKNDVDYLPSDNPQMPPDFYLDPDNKTMHLLEVKAFNYRAAPGFDIADFNAFQQGIIKEPHMLFAKYLIFGYDMSTEGVVTVKKIWLKSLWEITRPMQNWSINLQVKRGTVQKIRPATWYSQRGKFKTFNSLEDFLSAMEECVYTNPATHKDANEWKPKMLKSFKEAYEEDLIIPRWYEIKDNYIVKREKKKKAKPAKKVAKPKKVKK